MKYIKKKPNMFVELLLLKFSPKAARNKRSFEVSPFYQEQEDSFFITITLIHRNYYKVRIVLE